MENFNKAVNYYGLVFLASIVVLQVNDFELAGRVVWIIITLNIMALGSVLYAVTSYEAKLAELKHRNWELEEKLKFHTNEYKILRDLYIENEIESDGYEAYICIEELEVIYYLNFDNMLDLLNYLARKYEHYALPGEPITEWYSQLDAEEKLEVDKNSESFN